MLRHADTVTVGFAMGAHLIRRLDAVAATLGLGRPEAIHAAIVHWLDEEERKTARRDRMLKGCFRHQLLLPRPYLVLTKPLRLDIQCQRGASVKIGWKYLDD